VETSPEETSSTNKSVSQIQHLAWVIVLVSFAMFCSLSIAFSGGIYYFLFRSTMPMTVVVQVGQGSTGIVTQDNERIARRDDAFPTAITERPAVLSTGSPLDQATITISVPDESGDNSIPIATLTLESSSTIALINARRPRFNWSNGVYTLNFTEFSGEAEIFIHEIPERSLNFRIQTRPGNATYVFDREGRYSISANNDTIRVITYEGRALLVSPDNRNNRIAVNGEEIVLLTGANRPVVDSAPVNLIDNGLFAFDIEQDVTTGELQVPQYWACFNPSDGPPSGNYLADTWQGRNAIRLIRETGTETSRTGCRRWLDVSVAGYSSLELQATFALNYQSLVNCGVAGSECPMMIFVQYNDAEGENHTWYQSFFYEYDPQNPAPLVCLECAQVYEHRPIAEQVWFTYESGNLFTRLPENERPVQILDVMFYASGHRYDVFVSDISLIADTQVNVPPDQIPDGN